MASKTYGDQPYSMHLDAVVALLVEYGSDAQVIGYLHDVIEDTAACEADIRAKFGDFVADAVLIVTDEAGASRAERKRKTYRKMAGVDDDLALALVVKAADRLANVKNCIKTRHRRKFLMYQSEHAQFKQAAYRANLCDPLWLELDQLIAQGVDAVE